MKKGKVTVKVGEGDAKEELVGHSPEGNRFRFEHGSESKSKRDNVKKWEKVMRRKGWLVGLQRAIALDLNMELKVKVTN